MEGMDLTETIRIDTGIPFPTTTPGSHQQKNNKTIIAEICSEFTEYRAQVEYFKKNGLLRLVHDKDSLPIVFSLSEDSALCALRHGSHKGEGWACIDVSPTDRVVTSFDVVQVGSVLYIAAACRSPEQDSKTHELYYCTADVTVSNFHFQNEALAKKNQLKGLGWTLVHDNATPRDRVGSLVITSLLCNIVVAGEKPEFNIVVGTEQHDDRIATHYDVRTAGVNGRVWIPTTLPVAAKLLVQTEPLILGSEYERSQGLVSIVKDHSVNAKLRCIGQRRDISGGFSSSFEYKTGKLGSVRSAFSHLNWLGFTDVLVAGEKGIGFFSFQDVDTMSIETPILQDVSFKQIVASEAEDPSDPDNKTKFAIFAVSDEDCLYFIEGTRDFTAEKVRYTFEASGFPIRRGVTHLAARFNASHGTNELLYASKEENALFFLRRLPSGLSWIEDKITRKASRYLKSDAFVSSIVLTDGGGVSLPANYPVSLTADTLHVVANGTSCTLSQEHVKVVPDSSGCVLVAIPSTNKMSSTPFRVSVGSPASQDPDSKIFTFTVDPSQRVSRLLSKYDSADKLRNAKSCTGQSLMSDISTTQLEEAATLLEQYKTAKQSIEKPGSVPAGSAEEESWFDKAVDGVEKFLGDAIEMIKNVVKTGVKILIRVTGPVIKLVLKIAGNVIKWVLKGLWTVLECVGSGLELILGYDGLSKFLKAMKLAVDPKSIAKTQKFLADVVTGGLGIASRALISTKNSLLDAMDDGGDLIKEYIDDPRVPSRDASVPGWVKKIFNNPFTRLLSKINPLGWILEALFEEIPDLKLPDLGRLFDKMQTIFTGILESEAKILQQLWETLFQQLLVASSNPSKILEAVLNALKSVFWTFWDTARLFIEKAFDCLSMFLEELGILLKEEWTIPGLTDVWEDMTEQKFSLLGFLTFTPAAIINLYYAITDSRIPEFPPIDMSSIPISQFYKSSSNRKRVKLHSSAKKGEEGPQETSALYHSRVSVPRMTARMDAEVLRTQDAGLKSESYATAILNASQVTPTMYAEAVPIGLKTTAARSSAEDTTGDKDKEDEGTTWTMPHWYELIFEDLGKTYSGCWNLLDSVKGLFADKSQGAAGAPTEIEMGLIKGSDGGVPVSVTGANPQPAKVASRWWKVFRGLGKVLQGGALIMSAVITTQNIVVGESSSWTFWKIAVAFFGAGELVFFIVGCFASDDIEEICSSIADVSGSTGTCVRVVDDNEWTVESTAEFTSSIAVVVKLVADQVKKFNPEPTTKTMLGVGSAVLALTDLGCSVTGLVICVGKVANA